MRAGESMSSPTKNIARPFDAAILDRARKIAGGYQVVVRFDEDAQEYYGRGVELPTTMDDGKTAAECVSKTMEAMIATIAYMLEQGEAPPAASAVVSRT